MKTVRVAIKKGKVVWDFEGFPGRSCEHEENKLRALYGKMGVETDVEYSDNKREREAGGAIERVPVGS